MAKIISFSKNWNNKLDCLYFTTIRLYTREKSKYYSGSIGDKFDVVVKGNKYCDAYLVNVKTLILKDILNSDFLTYIDVGVDKNAFYVLMRSMYRYKPQWKIENTKMLLLLFKRDIGGIYG